MAHHPRGAEGLDTAARRLVAPGGRAFPARIGYAGWVAAQVRVQSTGTTPAGTFTLRRAFGALADPGTSLPYIRFDDDDYWPYEPRDPATYNVYQHSKSPKTHWRPGYAEHLSDFLPDYDYAAVIGFNLPRHISTRPAAGSGSPATPPTPGAAAASSCMYATADRRPAAWRSPSGTCAGC